MKMKETSDTANVAHDKVFLEAAFSRKSNTTRHSSSSRLRTLPESPQATRLADNTQSRETTPDETVHIESVHIATLAKRLRTLSRESDLTIAQMVSTLAEFDKREGWRASGARNCIIWMCNELGLCRTLAYERLRVARSLRELPLLSQLFAEGELGWSKIRYLTRVATPADERALAIMALDADANAVQTICNEYRWGQDDENPADQADADQKRHARRSVTISPCPDGSIAFDVVLPPDMAANLLRCLEHREEELFQSEPQAEKPTPVQRRADALVSLGEASLTGSSDTVSTADRFQVVAHIDVEALEDVVSTVADETQDPSHDPDKPLPMPLRVAIAGFMGGSITPVMARRLACDGSLVAMIMKNGEPIAVGRKTRTVNPATRRAVYARDGGCTFPGCSATRNLDVHHTHDWLHGGGTDSETLATVCRACHTRIHAEGWKIRRAGDACSGSHHPQATQLLADADQRTREMATKLHARRPTFKYERADSASTCSRTAENHCCEATMNYRVIVDHCHAGGTRRSGWKETSATQTAIGARMEGAGL